MIMLMKKGLLEGNVCPFRLTNQEKMLSEGHAKRKIGD
jgi:hypothetical protein